MLQKIHHDANKNLLKEMHISLAVDITITYQFLLTYLSITAISSFTAVALKQTSTKSR